MLNRKVELDKNNIGISKHNKKTVTKNISNKLATTNIKNSI